MTDGGEGATPHVVILAEPFGEGSVLRLKGPWLGRDPSVLSG
jgi:hypothetical protein